jgi:hypothetical protein
MKFWKNLNKKYTESELEIINSKSTYVDWKST